jgi:hypothetical protein
MPERRQNRAVSSRRVTARPGEHQNCRQQSHPGEICHPIPIADEIPTTLNTPILAKPKRRNLTVVADAVITFPIEIIAALIA